MIERLFPGIDIDEITSLQTIPQIADDKEVQNSAQTLSLYKTPNVREYTDDRSSLNFDMLPSLPPSEVMKLKREKGHLPDEKPDEQKVKP